MKFCFLCRGECSSLQVDFYVTASVHYADDRNYSFRFIRQIEHQIIINWHNAESSCAPRLIIIQTIAQGHLVKRIHSVHNPVYLFRRGHRFEQNIRNILVNTLQILFGVIRVFNCPSHMSYCPCIFSLTCLAGAVLPAFNEAIPF